MSRDQVNLAIEGHMKEAERIEKLGEQRQVYLAELHNLREQQKTGEKLVKEIEGQINAALNGSPEPQEPVQEQRKQSKSRTDKRVRNDVPTHQRIGTILLKHQNKAYSPADIADMLLRDGWKTKSKNPPGVVGITLRQHRYFKQLGTGKGSKYQLKKSAIVFVRRVNEQLSAA